MVQEPRSLIVTDGLFQVVVDPPEFDCHIVAVELKHRILSSAISVEGQSDSADVDHQAGRQSTLERSMGMATHQDGFGNLGEVGLYMLP
jgi:hypothetical protein